MHESTSRVKMAQAVQSIQHQADNNVLRLLFRWPPKSSICGTAILNRTRIYNTSDFSLSFPRTLARGRFLKKGSS